MNVLLATNVRPRLGGLHTFVNLYASALRADGHAVQVLTPLGIASTFEERPGAEQWVHSTLGASPAATLALYLAAQVLIALRLLILLARGARPDVLHCMDVAAFNALGWPAGRAGLPLALTVHGELQGMIPPGQAGVRSGRRLARYFAAQERRAYSRANPLTTVSAAMASTIRRRAPSAQPVVVSNFVDVDRFQPPANPCAARAALGVPADAPLLGFVGLLEPRKGPAVALRAVERLAGGPAAAARLVVAGDGPLRRELHEMADSPSLRGRVIFLGAVPHHEVQRVYQGIDALLLPSVEYFGAQEPAGLVALEAMACGVPVIASRLGGIPELVLHERTGLLVPAGDVDAWAAAIQRFYQEPGLRRRLSEAAIRHVRHNHAPGPAAQRFLALYRAASAAGAASR